MKIVSIADVHTILNNISEILIIVDIRGKVLIVNKHFEKLSVESKIGEGTLFTIELNINTTS